MNKINRLRNVEIRNWKFGLHALVLLMNVLSDSPRCSDHFVPLVKVVPDHIC